MQQGPLVLESLYLHPVWQQMFDLLLLELRSNFGPEGLVPPTLSSDPNSVQPAAPGGQLAKIAASPFKPAIIYDSFTGQYKARKVSGFVVIV